MDNTLGQKEAEAVLKRTTPADIIINPDNMIRWMGPENGWCLVRALELEALDNGDPTPQYEILKRASDAQDKEAAIERMKERGEFPEPPAEEGQPVKERFIRLHLEGIDPGEEGFETAARLAEVFERALRLAVKKNALYRDAWKKQGVIGNTARILGKTARLRSMVWTDFPVGDTDEPVRDTLLDLVNLGAFATINHEEDNRWGDR